MDLVASDTSPVPPKIFSMNSSRVISPFSIKSCASASVCARLETRSSSNMTGLYLVLPLCSLLDHSIRPEQHRLRNREADLFCCLQVDYQLELGWLRQRQFLGFGAF